MEKDLDHQKELQLLPPPPPPPPPAPSSSRALPWLNHHHHHQQQHRHRRRSSKPPLYPFESHEVDPSLDLQLRISHDQSSSNYDCVDALKWQAAEHIRLAAIENAYAERVRELTRLEIELAQSEFARARAMWDKAREEVAKAERLRDSATTCMGEITCYSCRQRFRPS
ncbi:uncharacterized protein LOC141652036 [Silene latifolia]|uniref:uncharacterized protein LOC141652036 n=1 Tax=Silene latifolia TaxID=37657 RepID=UPI003D78AEB9